MTIVLRLLSCCIDAHYVFIQPVLIEFTALHFRSNGLIDRRMKEIGLMGG